MILNCSAGEDSWESLPVHPKGDQSWVFIERTDAKAETPILWPSHVKSWLTGKDSDAGRDWGQEEKGATEDEMAWWHHWLDGRWVSVNSRSWWWTGRPGVLRFMGSQRVGRDWATELNWGRRQSMFHPSPSPCTDDTYSLPELGSTHVQTHLFLSGDHVHKQWFFFFN